MTSSGAGMGASVPTPTKACPVRPCYSPANTKVVVMTDLSAAREVVANFWKGVDQHDWDLVASTIADDFVRIGMRDDEADTSRGKADYMQFVSEVTGRMDHHDLKMASLFFSEDGRTAVAE